MIDWMRTRANRIVLWVGLAAIVLLADHYSALYYRMAVDDAYISMQYARNLYEGNGVVFNVGERVEGYTNFLWVVFMAPLYGLSQALHFDFVAWVGRANILIAGVEVWLLFQIGRRVWGDRAIALAAALTFCFVDNTFTVWPGLGLEGHFLGLWMLLALWALGSDSPHRASLTGLALTGAQMTRPDAGLFNAVVIGSLSLFQIAPRLIPALRALPEREPWKRFTWREIGVTLSVWVVLFGAYFLWRYQYYGWLLPNTFYLKVGGEKIDAWARGFRYVQSFFSERYWVPALALLAPLVSRRIEVVAITFYLVVHLAYVLYVGGDLFPGHRLLIAQIPMFALGVGVVVHGVVERIERLPRSRSVALVVAVLVMGVTSGLMWQRGRERGPLQHEVLRWRDAARGNRQLMTWLRDHAPEQRLATGDIGAAGLFANKYVIDLYGRIDSAVAHRDISNEQAGDETRAIREAALAEDPQLIHTGHVPADFRGDGYWFDASLPHTLFAAGIWRKDPWHGCARMFSSGQFQFDAAERIGLTLRGNAFEGYPMHGAVPGQDPVHGHEGTLINTCQPGIGDAATGWLLTQPFILKGDVMSVRVGGGTDTETLRVSLLIEGKRMRDATGRNSEVLGEVRWDIRELRGQPGRIEIVDEATGAWGHILVDEVGQYDLQSCAPR